MSYINIPFENFVDRYFNNREEFFLKYHNLSLHFTFDQDKHILIYSDGNIERTMKLSSIEDMHEIRFNYVPMKSYWHSIELVENI